MTSSSVRSLDYVSVCYPSVPDWQVLRGAILVSLETSPDAFLTSLKQVKDEKQEFWEKKLWSTQWAVVERNGQTLGVAAAKPPS